MGRGGCCFKVGYQEGFLLGDSGVEAHGMRGLSRFRWQLVTVDVWPGGGEARARWEDAVEDGHLGFYPKRSGKQAEGLEEEDVVSPTSSREGQAVQGRALQFFLLPCTSGSRMSPLCLSG